MQRLTYDTHKRCVLNVVYKLAAIVVAASCICGVEATSLLHMADDDQLSDGRNVKTHC